MSTRQEQQSKIAQARAAAEDMRKAREAQMPQGAASAPAPAPAPAAQATPHRRETDKPWDHADPRVTIPLQGRFPEHIHLKMLWVKEHTVGGMSLQKIMHRAVEEFCDREIERLGGPK